MVKEHNLKDLELNEPAPMDHLKYLVERLEFMLPVEYINFLQKHDGGEGFIEDNYIILWRADELIKFNDEYEVEKYAPGLFLFGSNGGGEAYGFDTRSPDMPVVQVPFIGMDIDEIVFISPGFSEFLYQR